MGTQVYRRNCKGCKRSKGIGEAPLGGIIELDNNWILNHYGGEEGFLGWMALQPRFHRMKLADLEVDELRTLGTNIKNIDSALQKYWSMHFKTDPIERVYVVYFFESAFDQPPTKFHLHIHLIPRTKKLRKLLRRKKDSKIIAWNIYRLSNLKNFPTEYKIGEHKEQSNQRVEPLMSYLRSQL
jgi:diadenosine tetraphosphate (Ap4A) HIT family hydrolase